MYFLVRLAVKLHIDIRFYIEMYFTCLEMCKCTLYPSFCGGNEINGSVQKWIRNLVRLYLLFSVKRGKIFGADKFVIGLIFM